MKRSPIAPVSKKRRPLVRKRSELLKARQGDPCEVRWDELCTFTGTTLHEPLLRSRGGNPGIEDGNVWLCFNCHFNIHAHPAEAHWRGWMLHAWEVKP